METKSNVLVLPSITTSRSRSIPKTTNITNRNMTPSPKKSFIVSQNESTPKPIHLVPPYVSAKA